MSTVTGSVGRVRNAAQSQRCRSPVSVVTVSSHSPRSMRGVGPADRTGKSSTRYCPGGSAALGTLRLPLNPGDTVAIVVLLACPPGRMLAHRSTRNTCHTTPRVPPPTRASQPDLDLEPGILQVEVTLDAVRNLVADRALVAQHDLAPLCLKQLADQPLVGQRAIRRAPEVASARTE